MVGSYLVFSRLFPPPPTPQEIADRRIKKLLDLLRHIETYSCRTQCEQMLPFIQSFCTTNSTTPIPDLLKALSSNQLRAISAHERTMGSILLLGFLLTNSIELRIKRKELISSVKIFIEIYERYFDSAKGYDQSEEKKQKQVTSEIRSLISKLVAHKLESYVLEIVSVWNRKQVTIHEAPVDWFTTWLESMMGSYGKKRVEKELNLEEWACRVRKANQPKHAVHKQPFSISTDSNEETHNPKNGIKERISDLTRMTLFNIQRIIACQRAEDWHKIREAARILGNSALEQEASENHTKFTNYHQIHAPSSYEPLQ